MLMLEAAELYLRAGLSIIPTVKETKAPAPIAGKWGRFQKARVDEQTAGRWFKNGDHCIALICGAVSGNLEVLDFDQKGELYLPFMRIVLSERADLQKKLVIEKSQNGGYHVFYRCAEAVAGNLKLSERGIKVPGPGEHSHNGKTYRAQKYGDDHYIVMDLIETRGEGGYFLCAPSPGYELKRGDISRLPVISKEDRDYLIETARALNEWVVPKFEKNSGKTPWTEYNETTDPLPLLTAKGWTELRLTGHTPAGGRTILLRRPGKTQGHSGSVIDGKTFYCFSANAAPFEPQKAYSSFQVYALLNHGGDFKRAGRALSKDGFGDKQAPREKCEKQQKFFMRTDLGNGERFAAQHRGKVLYCHPWEKWFIWDGKRWKLDGAATATKLAKQTVRSIYGEAEACEDDEQREQIAKWASKSEAKAKIDAMIALARSEPGIPVEPEDLDSDGWLLNCQNGTLNLKNGAFLPANPDHKITKIVNSTCSSDAACPTWLNFLEKIMDGNQELIEYLRRAIGYSLTGDDSEQCMFLLYGTGSNGKSTFLDTIKYLLGDYARQAEFSTFLMRKNDTVRNDIADLRGSRFVVAIETENGQRLAESIVKQMTGGDTLKARFLFKEYFEFQPTFKIWLAANHKPVIRGTDNAIWRRIRLVPFAVTIADEEKDKLLKEKLKAEMPGILLWAVQGCLEWKENGGLGGCEAVETATAQYRCDMDAVSDFIDECCLVDDQCRVPKSDLYATYEAWCSKNGEEKLSKRTFGTVMSERGFKDSKVMSKRFWTGLAVRSDAEIGTQE